MNPPMLDPRTAIRAASTPLAAASRRAIAPTSATASGDIAGSLAPCPRWSNASAAQPLAAASRAKSAWFSLQEPAPWRMTTPGQGGGGSGRVGCPRVSAAPGRSGSQSA